MASITIAHTLLLSFTNTCSFILTFLGVEGAADRDVQTEASRFLHTVEETTVLSHIQHATLEHIADAGTQAQSISGEF